MKQRAIKTAICFACGVLLFLSCADFDIWPLTWFAVVPLIAICLDPTTKKPAYYGFVCGLVANGGGFYWIVGFLQRFGHLPFVAAVPIWLLLVSYQAITFVLFVWILRKLNDHLKLPVVLIAPIIYVAVEMVVPYVFPWYLSITQAWVRPIIQIADLTGPLGVSFLIILSNAAIYEAWAAWRAKQPFPRRRIAAAAGAIAATLAYGVVRIHQVEASRAQAPKLQVGVVQANIGIHEKWDPRFSEHQLEVHQRKSVELEGNGAQLIIWPESSYPYTLRRDQAHDWPQGDPARAKVGFTSPLLFGSLTVGGRGQLAYNTALLYDQYGNTRGMFDKNILMVFGEYIPYFEQMKWLKKYIPEMSNFARGTKVTVFPLETPQGTVNVGPMICYEDIFPSFGRRLAALSPNLLVNITNDAWFGRTSEPYEHLALSVYRAVELRLDLVRAVNTGVSAFIDSTGRVYDKSPSVDPDETPDAKPVALLDPVAVQQPFTLYARLGEWFGGACMVLLAIFALVARKRAGRPVRWPLVAIGAAGLFVAVMLLMLLLAGPGNLGVALALLAHRPAGEENLAFSVGVRLVPAVLVGCIAAGVAIAWRARERAPLEAALAVLAVLVVPALAVGTLEGEQAGLVIAALAGISVASYVATRVARRF
jgi:apolipoprotein N-acyltransferase